MIGINIQFGFFRCYTAPAFGRGNNQYHTDALTGYVGKRNAIEQDIPVAVGNNGIVKDRRLYGAILKLCEAYTAIDQ